jgi:hypothetical protein
MVRRHPEAEVDRETLVALGDEVFPKGGERLLEMMRQVRAGEKLVL